MSINRNDADKMKSKLLSNLEKQISDHSAVEVGLAAHNLGTIEKIFIKPDVSFHPASTFKTCVMMEAFHQAEGGQLSLDDELLVKNEFPSIADGSPFSLSIEDDAEKDLYTHLDESLPIRDLIRRMIDVSSNLATNILIQRLTPEKTTAFMHELGADGLVVRRGVEDGKAFRLGLNNVATARGLACIFEKLEKHEIVSRHASDEMIDILCRQQFNEMIPAQLPEGIRVAHKTGWNDDLYHDSGIVYPLDGHPFVLVILTRGISEEKEAHRFVAALARTVYDHWVN